MAREQFQNLTEPMYYILLSLFKEPKHGYEIMHTISEISSETVNVGAGTLYTLLTRFEKEGMIVRVNLPDSDPRRKTYAITEKGRAEIGREYERLKQSINAYCYTTCDTPPIEAKGDISSG